MPSVRGSRYRNDYDNIEHLEPIYREEIIKVNEKLKMLNAEQDNFDKKCYGGILGIIRKRKKVYLKKDELSNYGLDLFMEMINSDDKLKHSFQNDIDFYKTNKFWNGIIYTYFDILSDRLYATTYLIELIEKYKKSNFKINNLYEKLNEDSPFQFMNILFSASSDILQYISNPEIYKYGKQLYDEITKNNEEKKKITKEIEQLETTISSKLSKKTQDLNQLRQYKENLIQVSNLLSNKEDDIEKDKENNKKI